MPHHPVLMEMVKPPAAGIVTSNLVLHLDAGDSASYPGTGTTWTDLSASGNDVTLSGSPTWSSAEGGHFVFDGTDDYGSGTMTDFPSGNADCTMSVWCTLETSPSRFAMAIAYGEDVADESRGLGHNPSDEPVAAHYGGNDIVYASAMSTSTWYNFVVVHDSGGSEFFVNNVSRGTNTATLSINTSTGLFYVGQQINIFSEFWNGKISHCLIYDAALTTAQLTQNYNAIVGRY